MQVADNGPGIDPAHLDNIFVPFFTTKRGGTGVGLSISRQLVQANRGFISVKSGESGGSVFVVSLPAAGSASAQRSALRRYSRPVPRGVAKFPARHS